MDRWNGRVAVVTGASAGIGAAIVKDLIKSGMIVVGLARRTDRIKEILLNDQTITKIQSENLYAIKCDFKSDTDICDAFNWIEINLKRIDVLINNAGIIYPTQIISDDNNEEQLKDVIQVNLTSVVLCIKKSVAIMKKIKIDDGHIININSTLGYRINVGKSAPIFNVYPSTKHGITALTEVIRQELMFAGTKIKVTSLSPGIVKTETWPENMRDAYYNSVAHLQCEDISNAILYVLGTPPHVQIHELTVLPVG